MSAITDGHIEYCKQHNELLIAGNTVEARIIDRIAHGYLKAARVMGHSIGHIIISADLEIMKEYPDSPMCGGMLFEAPEKEGA